MFAPWIYQWHADAGLGHDPEGLLSTLGALASTVLGLLAGGLLRSGRAAALAGLGVATAVLGLLLAVVLPLNKQLWTPSYVLWTGSAALGLWLGHLLIDQKGWPALGRRFGVNAITAYLGASVMSVVLMATGVWGGSGSDWPPQCRRRWSWRPCCRRWCLSRCGGAWHGGWTGGRSI